MNPAGRLSPTPPIEDAPEQRPRLKRTRTNEGIPALATRIRMSQERDVTPPVESPPIHLSQKDPAQRGRKNLLKAFKEHGITDRLPPEELPHYSLEKHKTACGHFSLQGTRPYQEDRSGLFHDDTGEDLESLFAIFDGHGNDKVSDFCSEHFDKYFFANLESSPNDRHKALQATIFQLHEELIKTDWYMDARNHCGNGGSCAAMANLNRKTGEIHTATLGDCEAFVLCENPNGTYSIDPLSVVRNWASKEDAKHAADILKKPEIAERWPEHKQPKYLRVNGLNVSRSIGDVFLHCTKQKIKYTYYQWNERSRLIFLASDGVTDVLDVPAMEELLNSCMGDLKKLPLEEMANQFSERLVMHAHSIQGKRARKVQFQMDNTSVLTFAATPQPRRSRTRRG